MTLKPQLDKTPSPAPVPPDWGVLSDAGELGSVIRFECTDGAYSYPYHALARWVLLAEEQETLLIQAGADEVTVRGRELVPVRDVLESGRLRVLRAASERYANRKSDTVVAHVSVGPATEA